MRARGLTVPLLCSLAIVAGAPAALAGGTSLYSGPGPRPGPDVLYGAPAVAPQLENVGVWSAAVGARPGDEDGRGGPDADGLELRRARGRPVEHVGSGAWIGAAVERAPSRQR